MAVETSCAGILSSLHPKNERAARRISVSEMLKQHSGFPMLFDPQTAGGLLASVPSAQADACAAQLRELGYKMTSIIGSVRSDTDSAQPVLIE